MSQVILTGQVWGARILILGGGGENEQEAKCGAWEAARDDGPAPVEASGDGEASRGAVGSRAGRGVLGEEPMPEPACDVGAAGAGGSDDSRGTCWGDGALSMVAVVFQRETPECVAHGGGRCWGGGCGTRRTGLLVETTSWGSGGWTPRPLGALLGAAPWGPPGQRVGGRARLTQSHPHCRLCLTPYFLWVQFLLLLSALLPTVSQGRRVCRV